MAKVHGVRIIICMCWKTSSYLESKFLVSKSVLKIPVEDARKLKKKILLKKFLNLASQLHLDSRSTNRELLNNINTWLNTSRAIKIQENETYFSVSTYNDLAYLRDPCNRAPKGIKAIFYSHYHRERTHAY